MKKALLYGLSAVMLLSLTACGTARAEQPDPVQSPGQSKGIEGYITQSPQSEGEVGVIESQQKGSKFTDAELEEYFRTAYDFVGITYDGTKYNVDDRIKEEISFLASLITDDGKLSHEYENKYMAWRPAEPSQGGGQTQQGGNTQTPQGGNTQTPQGGNTQTPQGGNTQTPQGGNTQTPQGGNSGGPSYYNGFSTYEEYIADIHRQYPEYSIEQIKETFPDPAGIYVDQDVVNQDIKDGRLNGN